MDKAGLSWRTVRFKHSEYITAANDSTRLILPQTVCARTSGLNVTPRRRCGASMMKLIWGRKCRGLTRRCALQLGTVLLLAMLTSLLTSRLAQPNPGKQSMSSIDQVEKRYSSLMKKLQDAEQRWFTQ